MKHLFSSGEIMFKKNQKTLKEGLFVGEYLEFDAVEQNTEYVCIGKMGDKPAKVCFTLAEDEYEGVKSRFSFNILMQSDVFNANWKSYCVQSIE
jgi:hypothetical protein